MEGIPHGNLYPPETFSMIKSQGIAEETIVAKEKRFYTQNHFGIGKKQAGGQDQSELGKRGPFRRDLGFEPAAVARFGAHARYICGQASGKTKRNRRKQI